MAKIFDKEEDEMCDDNFTCTNTNACTKFLHFVFRTRLSIFDLPASLDSQDPRKKNRTKLMSVYIQAEGILAHTKSRTFRSFPKRWFKQELQLRSHHWSLKEQKARKAKHRHWTHSGSHKLVRQLNHGRRCGRDSR